MLGGVDEPVVWSALLGATVVLVVLVLRWIEVPYRRFHGRLEERFVWGVPWGSLVVVAGLLAVYLFVQRGWWHWDSPVVVAYTAVSIWDPTGWLLAGFSHVTPSHLRGNVTSTLVFAPIVEWMWGHYPRGERGGRRWTRRPLIRALLLFPLGIASIAVVAALFSWGPVIGFSVAVYALVGIVLVYSPALAVVGLVVREAVRIAWRSLTDPVQISRASVQVVEPSWYGSAVQGHLIGLLLGVLVGLWLLDRREYDRAPAVHVFVGTVLIGSYLSVWSIWWILGTDRYILFRGAGVIVVLLLATVVCLTVVEKRIRGIEARRIALAIVVVAVAGMAIVGFGLNLAVADSPDIEPAYEVADYDIYYGEEVPNGMVAFVDIDAFGLSTDVRTSGVIVTSEERNVWRRSVPATELETHGVQRFHVGGIGWSEELYTVRRGWELIGNDTVYDVWIGDGDEFDLGYTSESQTIRTLVANHTFTMVAEDGQFHLEVGYDGSRETVPVPEQGDAVTVGDIELLHVDQELVARTEGTAVPIATHETYE